MTRERLPVDHLQVFVRHVEGPEPAILAAPVPLKRAGLPARARTRNQQVAPVSPHLLYQRSRCLTLVGLEQKLFIGKLVIGFWPTQIELHTFEKLSVLGRVRC